MNKRSLALIFLLSLIHLAWIPASRVPENPEDQKLFYLRQGRVYTKGYYVGADKVKGEILGLIFAPPEKVWLAYINGNNWKQRGIPMMQESLMLTQPQAQQLIKQGLQKNEDIYPIVGSEKPSPVANRHAGGKWRAYAYQYYDFPWPVSNRWIVIDTTLDETKASEGIYRMEFEKVAGNIKTLKGFCELSRFEGRPDVTLFNYQAQSHPGIPLPRIFIKWGVTRVMPIVVNALRAETDGKPRLLE